MLSLDFLLSNLPIIAYLLLSSLLRYYSPLFFFRNKFLSVQNIYVYQQQHVVSCVMALPSHVVQITQNDRLRLIALTLTFILSRYTANFTLDIMYMYFLFALLKGASS